MKVIVVVGARPNFMKAAPIIKAMTRNPSRFEALLVHTGQHYDRAMSEAFFDPLGLPKPDLHLGIGSGSHADQTGRIMMAFERVCETIRSDLVLVVGDVNSTLACAITAKKLGIMVGHVEAGLRSRDMTMPEEINRVCTDRVSDFLFTTDPIANENLRREGIADENIYFVGNTMIDTLLAHRELAAQLPILNELALEPGCFATVTLHRASNVDNYETLAGILEAFAQLGQELPIVFPVHPRTRKMVDQFGLGHYFKSRDNAKGIRLTEPLGYLEFLCLTMNSRMVMTDSGGLQEETTVLGIPCLTLRPNTERPITCLQGTNQVIGNRKEVILEAARKILRGDVPGGRIPEKWDGRASERIVGILLEKGTIR